MTADQRVVNGVPVGEVGRSTIVKLTRRLVVPLSVLLFLNAIDRTNISFIAQSLEHDIGLSASAYGLGVSIFFAGYLALQIPSVLLLRRIGMGPWLLCIGLLWGSAAIATAFVVDHYQYWAARAVLGIAEAGFAPGVIFYLSRWIPADHRSRSLAVVMMAVPVSMIVSGPLSVWLLSMNVLDIPAWRWMLLAEGVPTLIVGVLAFHLFREQVERAP
jgi:MFS transporter, ACS family, tartrate transporter